MAIHMIGVLYKNKDIIGYRLLNDQDGRVIDKDKKAVTEFIRHSRIENIELDREEIKGSNGDISRYGRIEQGRFIGDGTGPIVILAEDGEDNYIATNYSGKVINVSGAKVIAYSKQNGIANGKIMKRGETEYISAICGSYIKYDKPNSSRVLKGSDAKKTENRLSNRQMGVLNNYYKETDKLDELADIIEIVMNDRVEQYCKESKLLYEVLAKLRIGSNIEEVLGSELASKVIQFLNAGIPIPISLREDISTVFKDVDKDKLAYIFKGLSKELANIDSECNEIIECIRYILSNKVVKNSNGDKDSEYREKYALTEFDIGDIIALISVTDFLIRIKMKARFLIAKANRVNGENANTLYIKMIGEESRITENDIEVLMAFSNRWFSGKSGSKEMGYSLSEICEICNKRGIKELAMMFMNRLVEINEGGFYRNSKYNSFTRYIDHIVNKMIIVEQEQREAKEKAEQEAKEKAEREAKEKAEQEAKEKAEREAKKKAEPKDIVSRITEDNSLNKLEKYIELRKINNSYIGDSINIKIADDICRRGLKYEELSYKQIYRVKEAITDIVGVINGDNRVAVENIKENKNYSIEARPDVSRIIDYLDGLREDQKDQLICKEPNIFKICRTILKNKRVSDKQLARLESGYKIAKELGGNTI